MTRALTSRFGRRSDPVPESGVWPGALEAPQEFIGKPELSPLVAILTATALGVVGLIAGYFPAREASKLDPVVAMKL